MLDLKFYRGKRVLLTGHTGFKGAWMSAVLSRAGARVVGYSDARGTEPRLYDLCQIGETLEDVRGDVRDLARLRGVFDACRPELVFHLAAQAIVRTGYQDPVDTYSTNVMGTVNVLECARHCPSVRSVVIVTTDKVYENQEWDWGYRETDRLGGWDPYAGSKACAELVTASYIQSFFQSGGPAVSTARAGNVIGGGDFAPGRLIPDCVRAALRGDSVVLRNPQAVRPFQRLLEPVAAYLMIAAGQYENPALAGSYNVGPEERDCLTALSLAELFARHWGEGFTCQIHPDGGMHEAGLLKLDCARLRRVFHWSPRWSIEQAVAAVVSWSKCRRDGGDLRACLYEQIRAFFAEAPEKT